MPAESGFSINLISERDVHHGAMAEAGGKEVAAAKSSSGKEARAETSPKKQQQAGGEKTAAAPGKSGKTDKGSSAAAKESGTGSKAARGATPTADAGSFSSPAVAAAFKHVLKKYPNALRKLTD